MANRYIISGATATGKSTFAKKISEEKGIPIIAIREHYRNYLVPLFLKENNLPKQEFNRELTIKAADWIYKKKYGYIKQFLKDIKLPKEFIIESLRVKEDVEYLMKLIDFKWIYLVADEETKLKRILNDKNEMYKGKSKKEILSLMRHEIKHYKLNETEQFAIEKGAEFH